MECKMPICPYYRVEEKSYRDPQKRPTIDQVPPLRFTIIWCDHKEATLMKNEKGELECKGEVGKISSCPLIKNQQ